MGGPPAKALLQEGVRHEGRPGRTTREEGQSTPRLPSPARPHRAVSEICEMTALAAQGRNEVYGLPSS